MLDLFVAIHRRGMTAPVWSLKLKSSPWTQKHLKERCPLKTQLDLLISVALITCSSYKKMCQLYKKKKKVGIKSNYSNIFAHCNTVLLHHIYHNFPVPGISHSPTCTHTHLQKLSSHTSCFCIAFSALVFLGHLLLIPQFWFYSLLCTNNLHTNSRHDNKIHSTK